TTPTPVSSRRRSGVITHFGYPRLADLNHARPGARSCATQRFPGPIRTPVKGHIARMAFIVWSTPHDGVGEQYHRSYDEVHLPDAIENGSFTAMHRYESVGPGYCASPFLSIAEADYGSAAEAWASVRPRAQALRDAGRIDDLYRVDFAVMLLTVDADVSVHE